MPMSSPARPLAGTAALLCAAAMLVVGLPATVRADNHPIKIHRLGNPNSAISKTPARTVEDVQRLAKEYETALMVALAQSTFDGDPQDVFDAIARGDGEMVSITPGTNHQWMVFRKGGQPTISTRAVEWAGRKPIDAYRTTVASGRYVYTFDIPLTCMNLALFERRDAPPPSCTLEATASTPDGYDVLGDVAIRASSDDTVTLTGVAGPSGSVDAGEARSTGANTWTLAPTEAGRHTFTATVTDDYGRTATCTAAATVAPKKVRPVPVCNLSSTYDPETGTITVDASGSKGTVTIDEMTLPDGAAGDLGAMSAGDANRWTYTPKVPRRAGDYTYRFAGEANLPDALGPVGCETSTTVTVESRAGEWILRGYGASISGDDEATTDDGFERAFVNVGKGTGVGLGLEYLFSSRWGIEGGVLFANLDSDIFIDRADLWVNDSDEVGFLPIMLGLNYHLTPGRKADFYIGPFVALVQYDSPDFNLPVGSVRPDLDDDVGFGLNLGVDVPFGDSRWGFNGGLRYLQTSADEDGGLGRSFDIDPLIFSAGLGYRF